MKLKCNGRISSCGFFVLICCLSPFRIPVSTHLSTAFPVVSSDVPKLPEPVVASQISPKLPSVCQEGLCHNGGTCHPLALPTGAASFRCDCPLHFTGRVCEKGSRGSFFLCELWNASLRLLWAGKGGEVIIIITFLCFSSQSLLVTPE